MLVDPGMGESCLPAAGSTGGASFHAHAGDDATPRRPRNAPRPLRNVRPPARQPSPRRTQCRTKASTTVISLFQLLMHGSKTERRTAANDGGGGGGGRAGHTRVNRAVVGVLNPGVMFVSIPPVCLSIRDCLSCPLAACRSSCDPPPPPPITPQSN